MIATKKFLLRNQSNERLAVLVDFLQNEYKKENRTSAFLSHSHKDKEIAEGLVSYLTTQNLNIYIDWKDASMPPDVNRETANKIKDKIKSCDLFLILATMNALNSKWVPWEIGIADQCKAPTSILIIPVAFDNGHYEGNEYMQLYHHIEISDNGTPIIPTGIGYGDIALNNWIKLVTS